MTRRSSFTKIENDVLPKFRDSMAQAESTADVQKFFVYTMLELINSALDGGFDLVYEDITLTPGSAPGLRPRTAAARASPVRGPVPGFGPAGHHGTLRHRRRQPLQTPSTKPRPPKARSTPSPAGSS